MALDGGADAERYERLRRQAVGGEPSGWRLGLGVLEHRGVAAWMRAWRTTTPAPPATRPTALGARASCDEIVGVLAQMALACLGGR